MIRRRLYNAVAQGGRHSREDAATARTAPSLKSIEMSQTRMSHTRLNVFQRLVRQWDTMHPYNAAQLLRIDGDVKAADLNEAWNDTIAELGLGKICIDGYSFHYEDLGSETNSHLPR